MGTETTCAAGSGQRSTLERVRYFSRQLISADDLTQEQDYYRERRRLHNRLLHGFGIACGLGVTATPTASAPLTITVHPGYGLSQRGDEIYVQSEIVVDLAMCIAGPKSTDCCSPCSSIAVDRVDPLKPFYLGIKYVECPARPVRVAPIGCGCDDSDCEYTRIRDSFEIRCLAVLPSSHETSFSGEDPRQIPDLCTVNSSKVVPCPPVADDPWLIVAKISITDPRTSAGMTIDGSDRRILVSTAILQHKLITGFCI